MFAQNSVSRRAFVRGATGALGAVALAACSAGPSATEAVSQESGDDASQETPAGAPQDIPGQAEPLQCFDMHGDTIDVVGMAAHLPYAGFTDKFQGSLASTNAQISADRMGDVRWAQGYAIWIPPHEGEDATDLAFIDWYREGVKWFAGQMERFPEQFTQARRLSDIPAILDEGKVAAILTVENAACLDAGIEVVDEFARDGVLIAGVTWNSRNVLGSGNDHVDEGLTDLGKDYVRALEEHRIVVDVSHLNDKGFWDLEKVAERPFVATHSNSRAVCDVLRNLTDDQFRAIAERGGIVGLNFHAGFVHPSDGVYTFDELAAHVEHWLELGGEDAIALGSDRDGANIPTWLADCGSQAHLFRRFADRLGEEVARKIFFDNAERFWKAY